MDGAGVGVPTSKTPCLRSTDAADPALCGKGGPSTSGVSGDRVAAFPTARGTPLRPKQREKGSDVPQRITDPVFGYGQFDPRYDYDMAHPLETRTGLRSGWYRILSACVAVSCGVLSIVGYAWGWNKASSAVLSAILALYAVTTFWLLSHEGNPGTPD